MRSSFSSSDLTVNLERRLSQSSLSSSSAAYTCSSVLYFARSSSAGFLLITLGATNFSSTGFSQYPRTKIKLFVSSGSRVTFIWCEPIGLHPLAIELWAFPSSTTAGHHGMHLKIHHGLCQIRLHQYLLNIRQNDFYAHDTLSCGR